MCLIWPVALFRRHNSNFLNFPETKHTCVTFKFFGECVDFQECPFTSKLSDVVLESDVREFRDRVSACSSYGKRLMCCEKSANVASNFNNRPMNYRPTQPVRTTWRPPSTFAPYPVTTSEIPTSHGDPVTHPNYRFFQNLKCGSVFINRVAHGMPSESSTFDAFSECFIHRQQQRLVRVSMGCSTGLRECRRRRVQMRWLGHIG